MKKIIRGIFIPLVISMLFGFISAKIVYIVYSDDLSNKLSSSRLYLIENGKYLTYDNMREENSANNYIYYQDDDGYKSVIGITKEEGNIEKISKLYSGTVSVREYYISSELINEKQDEYDMVLSNTNDIYIVKETVDNILNLYRDDKSIKLVTIK